MADEYSVPQEAKQLLSQGIIDNPLHASAPDDIKAAASMIEYVGTNFPVIPINWRFAESISAIKGFQGAMLNVLLKEKYGLDFQKIVIDTDHAQLFIMSIVLSVIDPHGAQVRPSDPRFHQYFPKCDKYEIGLGSACTSIYKTRDGRFYHLHGSLNPQICQDVLEIPLDARSSTTSIGAASEIYQEKVSKFDAAEIESLMNDKYRQAGTTCWSTEEYKSSEHGKANAHVGLFEIHYVPNPKQAPRWWTDVEGKTSASRPLFGLKIVDLTRIVASPAVTRELAELGASVMRITSPNITDFTALNLDMGWGKWNAHLDLTREEDRKVLRSLIEECDVVVDGYRPGVMKKWGFGKEEILGFFAEKDRGVIYAHENCYGWNGPWSHRSGWQQISDANCGVSLEFGRAMGNDEAVTPVFPNSDFCTGVAGATGILQALIARSKTGGSYVVDISLNYYSQWLVNCCSTYSPEVWDKLWSNYGRPVFRHHDNMGITIPKYMEMLKSKKAPFFDPSFFEDRENKALGVPVKTVKPILMFPDQVVRPGYNVGCRGNGVDKPKWPEDLLTEIVV